ncbi:MAG: hypothetical protein H0V70_26690 [Ktedonobacteraceae bacterium]|nr:hypothetical protein [Ktedonobacteraceae bacterium]
MLTQGITHVGGVAWESAFVQLAEVPGMYEHAFPLDVLRRTNEKRPREQRPKRVR